MMHGILFTTTTCPKCPAFKEYLAKHTSFSIDVLDEQHANFSQLIQQYGVTAAPTLFLFDSSDQEVFRTSDVSELAHFLSSSHVA